MIVLITALIDSDEDKEFILTLYGKYNRLIYNKIRNKICVYKDAEDLVNDTFIKLIEKIEILKTLGERELLFYIAKTADHVAIDYMKLS